jgi:ABC-type sugar transport system ATPase subunit
MPNVFEVADRIHIQRLGRGAGVVTPQSHTPAEAVAIMTGAVTLEDAKTVRSPDAAASPTGTPTGSATPAGGRGTAPSEQF